MMVFHIAAAHQRIRVVAVLELAEYGFIEFFENIGLHIESSPMSHAQDEFAAPPSRFVVGKGIEHGDNHFRPFDGKAFLAHIPGMQELIEKGGLAKLVQNAKLRFFPEPWPIAGWFQAFLQPQSLPGVLEMHDFDANRAAVGFLEHLDEVAQPHLLHTEGLRDKEGPFEVGVRKLKGCQVQKGMTGGTGSEWVQARQQMAHVAIAVDEFRYARLPQHLAFFTDPRRSAFARGPKGKPFKKDLPLAGHALGIGLPALILGIHEFGIYRIGNIHIARSSGMNCTSVSPTCLFA